jgi:DNA-binding CsgD family transcriptional regulator
MGLFNIFKKKKKIKTREKTWRKSATPKTREYLAKLKSDIEHLQAQIGIIDIVLHKHDDDITEQTFVIKEHSQKLENLEQIATSQSTGPVRKLFTAINQPPTPANIAQPQEGKFNIGTFSNQEQRILSVFFQNQGLALSYADIAHSLNKSPHTIKNQMRQINMRADLFTKHVDEGNRNRFKLREGLKIEKYLNVN